MKEGIISVLSYPFPDKYVVVVARQGDVRHLPVRRTYEASYLDKDKITSLVNHYLTMVRLVQIKMVVRGMEHMKGLKKDESDS